jgi:dihydroxyacetone kinase-like predicted kinase
LARHLKDRETADARLFAEAMSGGVTAAYKAVMKPSEGTILTVSRLAAAEAVSAAETESDVERVLELAIEIGTLRLAEPSIKIQC